MGTHSVEVVQSALGDNSLLLNVFGRPLKADLFGEWWTPAVVVVAFHSVILASSTMSRLTCLRTQVRWRIKSNYRWRWPFVAEIAPCSILLYCYNSARFKKIIVGMLMLQRSVATAWRNMRKQNRQNTTSKNDWRKRNVLSSWRKDDKVCATCKTLSYGKLFKVAAQQTHSIHRRK